VRNNRPGQPGPRQPVEARSLAQLLRESPYEQSRDRASWLDTLKVFPWLVRLPSVRQQMLSDGVDPQTIELRGGARRYAARPARDKLHVQRGGKHSAEAARWTTDLHEFEAFAIKHADRVEITLNELTATFGDRARAYREWVRTLLRRVPEHALICNRLPAWPANVLIEPAQLRPGAALRKPYLITVMLLSRERSPGARPAGRRATTRSRTWTYLAVSPGHAAAGVLRHALPQEAVFEPSGAPLRRLVLRLCREEPPSDDDIRQRRRRWRSRER